MAEVSGAAPRSSHYDATAIGAHWLTFALVVAQFAVGWLMPEIGRGTQPIGLIAVHLALGASIFVLIVLRLIWRFTRPGPEPLTSLPHWQRVASTITHFALYLLLILLSLTGWASASARSWSVKAFGLFRLPDLVAPHVKIGFIMGDVHAGALVWLLLALIILHVAAALYHRLVRRDTVLQRMLPGA